MSNKRQAGAAASPEIEPKKRKRNDVRELPFSLPPLTSIIEPLNILAMATLSLKKALRQHPACGCKFPQKTPAVEISYVASRITHHDTFFVSNETAETTIDTGMKLMRLLKKSTDKTGRIISTHFLDLPSRDDYPQYYVQVKMPISLNMIEEKLEEAKYDTMEKLESDLKRLVQNAKEFNSTKSEVYEDAERIRKALSNFMPKHNPSYQDPNYHAYPTPIPQELLDAEDEAEASTPAANIERPASSLGKRRKSAAVSTDGGESTTDDMKSKQIELLDLLMEQPDSVNFYEKPPKREYPEYYKVIKRPMAILDVKSLVEKNKIFDWESFASEVRLIWENAKEFNEDGSEIYEMARELDEWFEGELDSRGVMPKRPKIKINQPRPPPTLVKFIRSTPNPAGASVTVDNDSLRRQREETGQTLHHAVRGGSRVHLSNASSIAPANPAAVERSASATVTTPGQATPTSSSIPHDGIKVEAIMSIVSGTSHTLPVFPRDPIIEGTPTPINAAPTTMVNGTNHHGYPSIQQPVIRPVAESENPIERKYRDAGKGIEDALLGSVTYMTHPKLPQDPKWKMNRYASGTRTQTSSYIYLPADHYYLRVIPNLTKECLSRRKYKVCLTRSWESISATHDGAYDFRLHPGMNEVVVDVIAELAEGETKSYAPPQLQVDFERIKFFIWLREATTD